VVAMGGQGKTTLARKVFESKEVVGHFEYRRWITVSQSYNIEELLRSMLKDLCEQQKVDPPEKIHEMNKESLVKIVRNYLQEKRYVVVFDDVWNSPFWADIKFAMIDKQKGCRILITTRYMDVATSCRESCLVEIHELKGLDDEQSLKLFNKKAFYDLKEVCPDNLRDISSKIVKKCGGLPLAIVVTGGLLCKSRNTAEWYKFNENIKTKLKKDYVINKILVLSYHDLSYNLKSCLLYFGIYPEDSKVNSKRLIRQWIAEGFVKEEEGMTLEEIAEGYLTELIHRNLVQVVSVSIDGRAKCCRVHDLVHAMILEKFKDLSFFKNINVDGQSTLTGITRRLSVTTNSDNLVESINCSHVRSLFYIGANLSETFLRKITTKYRLSKVVVLKDDKKLEIPEDLGSLIYLKYLELKDGQKTFHPIPKSIGMLENLETLDLGFIRFYKMPKEICKLRKLRHFIGYEISLIELKDGLGGLTSLQTLRGVYLDEGEDDSDNSVIDLIQELGKLKQLRELVLRGVKTRYTSALSSSINEMQLLEKLSIGAKYIDTFIDMDLNSPPPMLRHLTLAGNLGMLPEWIPKLQNLVKLKLCYSFLKDDKMELLKNMPNLLTLSLRNDAYQTKMLHFQDGWFKNLKRLFLEDLHYLECILIDEGALPSLETLELYSIPKLDELPIGIQHLKKLKDLRIPSTAYYGGVFFLTEYNNYVIFNTNSLLLLPYLLFF
jgi:disease resistance protein RPM1